MCSRVYVLAQAIKHTFTQCVCKSHPDFQGDQLLENFATYTRINNYERAAWNRAKGLMWLASPGWATSSTTG